MCSRPMTIRELAQALTEPGADVPALAHAIEREIITARPLLLLDEDEDGYTTWHEMLRSESNLCRYRLVSDPPPEGAS